MTNESLYQFASLQIPHVDVPLVAAATSALAIQSEDAHDIARFRYSEDRRPDNTVCLLTMAAIAWNDHNTDIPLDLLPCPTPTLHPAKHKRSPRWGLRTRHLLVCRLAIIGTRPGEDR